MTEAQFNKAWPLAKHLADLVKARRDAAEKGSWTAVSSLLRQEGDAHAQRAEDYRAYLVERDASADLGDLVQDTARKLRALPESVREEIRAALGW